MKKKILLLVTVSALLIASFFIPAMIDKRITVVTVTGVKTTTHSDDIFVSGVVEELSRKDVSVKIPLVASRINCEIGDTVAVNQILAEVDVDATAEALLDLTELKTLIPAEYIEAAASLSIDPQTLKQYIPTVITSPADGVVTSMSITKGGICTPVSPLFTISSSDNVRLKLSVGESDIAKVKNGDTVVFKATASGEQKYLGTVELIFPTASKTLVGTSQATIVNIYVNPQEHYPALKPGFSINGVVKASTESEVKVIPYECIMQDSKNREYVYIANEKSVSRCYLNTGREFSEGVEVISPMLDGQKIIANPTAIKDEGGLIKIQRER